MRAARPWLLLLPALVVLGGLFLGGIAMAVARSLGITPTSGLSGFTLDAYRAVLSDQDIGLSLALSLWIAGASTALSALLAVPAALALRRVARGPVTFLFQLNLTIPHLVGAIGILYLFSQSGSFARLAHAFGAIERPGEFPALVHDPAAIGILLTYVWKELPFLGLVVLAQLQSLDRDFEAVARSLGASAWQRFRHVTLPMIAPGLVAASALVFAFTFGAYEVPALLGQNHPQALPVLAWRAFTDVDLDARPEAMALSVLIALVSAGLLWLYLRAFRAAPR
ncbi:ABC transporter permease subunit [Rhodobacterales bacterium HKCCE2091]|nr:ABC transporter permease subunit [Rhodobacterales bacterium HKCCE2091]